MKSVVEVLEDNKVKVSVEVDETEFDKAIDQAFKRLAREVRIPGFRPGKAPRKVLEARLGKGIAREEALRSALPDYYARAVIDHDVDVIAPPDIDITGGRETGPVQFDAIVETRPQVQVSGHDALTVTIPSPAVSETDIAERIDQVRRQHGELTDAERPVETGDYVTIDITGVYRDEEIPGLTTTDYLYEVGTGALGGVLDEHLVGAAAGTDIAFADPHPEPDLDDVDLAEGEEPDESVTHIFFEVSVQRIQERVLPDLTDEFAAEATEFGSVEEWRADVQQRVGAMKKLQANMARRDSLLDAIAGLVTDDVPSSMVDGGIQERIEGFLQRLQQQGATVQDYVQATGQTAEMITHGFRAEAEKAARVDLALRAIGEAEGLSATEDEVDEQVAEIAEQAKLSIETTRERLASSGSLSEIRASIAKRRALDWVNERASLVDPEGVTIDPDTLVFEQSDGEQTEVEQSGADVEDILGERSNQDLAEVVLQEDASPAPDEEEQK